MIGGWIDTPLVRDCHPLGTLASGKGPSTSLAAKAIQNAKFDDCEYACNLSHANTKYRFLQVHYPDGTRALVRECSLWTQGGPNRAAPIRTSY